MSDAKLRVGVLASGRGSNLQAIIDAIEAGKLAARVDGGISNKKDAQALERAHRHGGEDGFLDPAPYPDRPENRQADDRAVPGGLGKNDTAETLGARILVEEHRIYPEAIQLFADGRLSVEGRRVRIR